MDETQYNIPCTNHAVNLIKPDLTRFTPETQEKLKKLIEDFNKQYTSINWNRV